MAPPEAIQSETQPVLLAVDKGSHARATPTLESQLEPRDRGLLSERVEGMRIGGKAGEQLTDIVARYHDVVGELYEREADVQWLGNFSGVLGNILSTPDTLSGKDNTGCKHTQLTTYQAIAPLTSLESDAWQATPIRVGTGPFVHNAVAVWSSDVALEDASPDDVLVFDPWPQQQMEGSVRTLDEWQNVNSIVKMLKMGDLRPVGL